MKKLDFNEFPLEYSRGVINFLNCKIDLRNRVFIPRIETEFWVKKAIKELPKNGSRTTLDMCAGSGCIGIAILKNIKNSRVDFVDIEEKAIEQIKINLKLNKISPEKYQVIKSNLFEKLRGKKYDFIFANPPYVAKERLNEVQPSVLKYEPERAILAGKKGLIFIKKFLKEAKKFLNPGGIIYLEIDPLQKWDIENILKKEGYDNFIFKKDQFKKYRWLKIKINNTN
jgi:release factor glutamine methyltransferase